MSKEKLKGIVIGMIAASIVFSGITAFASSGSRTIPIAYDNIKVYVNGSLTPMRSDGKIVEPFTYQGRTYVPLRAVSEALNQAVSWDDTSKSIYIDGAAGGDGLVGYYCSFLYAADLLNQYNDDISMLSNSVCDYALNGTDPSDLVYYEEEANRIIGNMVANYQFISQRSDYFSDSYDASMDCLIAVKAAITTSREFNTTSYSYTAEVLFEVAMDALDRSIDLQADMRDTAYDIYFQAISEY